MQELDYVDSCQENGAFADAKQCDKYFICKNGEVSSVNPFRHGQNLISEKSERYIFLAPGQKASWHLHI